jgi:lysophospholipase L1-like esterase
LLFGARRALLRGAWLVPYLAVACAGCSSKSNSPPTTDAGPSGAGGTIEGSDGGEGSEGRPSDAEATGSPGIRWIGRVDESNAGGPRFAWSGSGFVATVSGTTISLKLRAASSDAVFFQPVIDGTPGDRFSSASGEQTVTLGSNLADGDHLVEVYRESEGRYGATTFEGFTDGTLKSPPASSGRRIELVGDSITAGYGNLGSEQHPNYGPDPDGGCPFTTQTESAYETYGAIAARTLNAEVSLVAVSGWGIVRDNGNNATDVLPNVYANTLGLSATPAWSFQPAPQAVIINLGTNDFATGDPGETQFEGAYTAFIATVRSKYPDAQIFCTVGPLLYGTGLTMATSYIQNVVSAAHASGDTKVQYLDYGQQNTSLGTGCQYHPNTTEHQAMATKLVTALRAVLAW